MNGGYKFIFYHALNTELNDIYIAPALLDCRFKIFYLIANPNERKARIDKGIDFLK